MNFMLLSRCLFRVGVLAGAFGAGHIAAAAGDLRAEMFPTGARVLFQGDSITDGNRGRNEDPNHILGHGYAFIIAAKYGAGSPERKVTFFNRGISGNTVAGLTARWQADTLDLQPDVLSVLIGINDISRGVAVTDYEAGYDKLLSDVVAARPGTRLVLIEPFALPLGKRKEQSTYGPAVQAYREAVARLAAKYKAVLVPLQNVFDDACKRAPAEYWIWDGIHPTYAGHQLIADAWVESVQKQLSK
jgi:lysophospholipase L1-like esterase